MIIKKFTAKTEEQAVQAARKELGDSLVVMNVKDTRKKGFFGFFSARQVEVTVALEEDQTPKPPVPGTIRQSGEGSSGPGRDCIPSPILKALRKSWTVCRFCWRAR